MRLTTIFTLCAGSLVSANEIQERDPSFSYEYSTESIYIEPIGPSTYIAIASSSYYYGSSSVYYGSSYPASSSYYASSSLLPSYSNRNLPSASSRPGRQGGGGGGFGTGDDSGDEPNDPIPSTDAASRPSMSLVAASIGMAVIGIGAFML